MPESFIQPTTSSLFSSTPFLNSPTLQSLAFLIGVLFLISKLYRYSRLIFGATLRPEINFLQRYGSDTYAAVTGASSGIGKAFCFALARRGFNIVMISKDGDLLEQVDKELKQKYPAVKTRIVVSDLRHSHDEGLFKNIMNQISDIDVSMLISNAGIGHNNFFVNLSEHQLKELITVNCIPLAVISKHFIERFLKRKHKSCLMAVSSFTASFPMTIFQTYGATKIFIDYFTRSIGLEYPEIDMLSVRPGYVDTKMSEGVENKVFEISAEECAEAALKDVGYETLTYGHWKHKILGEVVAVIPDWMKNLGTQKTFAARDKKKD